MKTRILGNFFLLLIVSLTAACGSGGGSDKDSQYVEITAASRCAFSPNVVVNNIFMVTPAYCIREEIEGGSYVTEVNTIHLSGTSSAAEDDGCPEPTLDFGGPICVPVGINPFNYWLSWNNSSNGASGNGEVVYSSRFGLEWVPGDNSVSWSTYNFFNKTIDKGIPLEMGSNTIRITTSNSGLKGHAEITITRVVDVTPPTVHSVTPEPGSSTASGGRIVVYFSEHLDPASVITAISVVDENNQPVAGASEYDPLELKVTWRPQSPLNPDTSHTARISGVTDWAPNVMIDPYEWSFTTRPLASLDNNNNVTIAGAPFCDDWGGTADFGCRIVPQGSPPNIDLTVENDSASISIEIVNQQHIELIDTDGEREKIAIAVFVTNSGADSASVSMRIGLTDEDGISQGYAIANTFPFEPGFSGLVAFTANPNFQNVSPMIYHGMLLEVEVAGGPLTFGEFSQANIFPVDPTSHVGN